MEKIIDAIKSHKIIILIFLTAFVVGFFWNHQFYFKEIAEIYSDQQKYNEVAVNIASGNGFIQNNELSNLEPGYPLFLASLFKISNYNIDFVRFTQLFLVSLTCVLIYLITKKIYTEKIARLAGFFSAFFWVFANYTGFLLRESLLVFLITLLTFLLYKAQSSKKNKYFILSGIVLGYLAITNGIIIYFLPFIIINFYILLRKKITTKKLFIKIILLLILFILIITPWKIRNKINNIESRSVNILGIRTSLMENLWPDMPKYYFGHLTGYYFFEKIWPDLDSWAFRDIYITGNKIEALEKEGYDKKTINKKIKNESIHLLKTHPHKYLAMSLLDLINFNSPLIPNKIFGGNGYLLLAFTEKMDMNAPGIFKASIVILGRLYWYIFLFLVIYALIKDVKNWEKISWLFLICLFFNGIYSAIHALPRYAVQIYPLYIILASSGFYLILNKFKK